MGEVPMKHRWIVGIIAVLAGGYATYKSGNEFQFVKFTPHSPEEIERRKQQNVGLLLKFDDKTTLDLTPEAKEKYARIRLEKLKQQEEQEKKNQKEG
ncbi:hypothetical protein Cantr_00956 [Candida viswanathii]|uniref:Uncharacterized protein n=1 Tax=Candida viswanathii TaxID=5486 RepID=A0A367YGM7_9ASCO|nr:hypothetical protein Cantr_00956 [Candida viswanathii]